MKGTNWSNFALICWTNFQDDVDDRETFYRFLEVKLRRLLRKPHEGKYDIRDKKPHVLYLQTVLVTAGPGVTI